MLEQIIVRTEDRPDILAEIGELLGESEVNIETISLSTHDGEGLIRLVVDDAEEAGELLASHGFRVEASSPVLAVTLDDRPGELGRYCRKLTSAGVEISAVYLARREGGETELIFAVDDLDQAQGA